MPGPSGKTARRGLPFGLLTDTPDYEADSKALAESLDQTAFFNQGLIAARPLAAASHEGDIYWATDEHAYGPEGTWFIFYGGAWHGFPLPTVTESELAAALLGPAAGSFGLRKLGTGATEATPGNDKRLTEKFMKDNLQPGVVAAADWGFTASITGGTGAIASVANTGGNAWLEDPATAGQLVRSVTALAKLEGLAPPSLPISTKFMALSVELTPGATWGAAATASIKSGVEKATQAEAEAAIPATSAGKIKVKNIIIKNTTGTYSIVNQFDARELANREPRAYYGDGSDGTITLDGANEATGFTRVGSVYTLTRDLYSRSLVINSGQTLQSNGFMIFCTGIVTNNGTIANNGTAAPGLSSVAGAGAPGGSLGAGGTGGTGGKGSGVVGGVGGSVANSQGGSGGHGGKSETAEGGVGGTATAPTGGVRRNALSFFASTLGGGAGGGGGAGQAGGAEPGEVGGGGGGGGGVVLISASALENNGNITANAGSGGAGNNVGGQGNTGGGGGGGCVVTICRFLTGAGSRSANGAAQGGSGGGHGTSGGAGTVIAITG